MKSTASEPGLRNLDNCYVDLEYIFCIKSSLHFHFDAYSLTNKRRANPKVIYLESLMLMPQQQHYTCHIRRSLSTNPSQAFLIEGDIGGYPIPQYRKKKWQIPKYRVENRLNTDTAYFNHIFNWFPILMVPAM